VALFSYQAGRFPAFLIKSPVFDVKLIGPYLHKVGQLPVSRGETDAALVLKDAERSLRAGECLIVYPEGTATRDPALWPMVARTPAAPRPPRVPGRPLGRAGHPAVRKQEAEPRAAAHGADPGRPTGRPVRLRGPAVEQGGAAGRDRRGHGRHHRPARAAARRAGARRALRSRGRPPRQGGGGPRGRAAGGRPAPEGGAHVSAAVMGAGMWGTTFAQVLCDAGTPAVLWGRRPELTEAINQRHENPDYLPGITLTSALRATCDPVEALRGTDLVVLAVPAQTLRRNLASWAALLPPDAPLVSVRRATEHGPHLRRSEVIPEVPGAGRDRIAVIPGPTLAREIAVRQYAATVVACADDAMAKHLQQACHTPYFRPYTNPDVIGSELGGAVKNVIALAVGISVGMGLG